MNNGPPPSFILGWGCVFVAQWIDELLKFGVSLCPLHITNAQAMQFVFLSGVQLVFCQGERTPI